MLDMKITEKPNDILRKIESLKDQVLQLESDYTHKTRGEVYMARAKFIKNKIKHYKNAIINLGKDSFTLWYLEVEYLDTIAIGFTEFQIRVTSIYDKEDVETLVKMRLNCIVKKCIPKKVYKCGEIVPIE